MLKVITTCPLGSECEKAVGQTIHRCAWFTEIEGTNPQNGDTIKSSKCAMSWIPILLVENANTNRGQTAAICSMRDESLKRQDAAIAALSKQPGLIT